MTTSSTKLPRLLRLQQRVALVPLLFLALNLLTEFSGDFGVPFSFSRSSSSPSLLAGRGLLLPQGAEGAIMHTIHFCFRKTFKAKHFEELLAPLKKKGNVKGLVSLEHGPIITNPYPTYQLRSDGYNYAIVSQHTSGAALKEYADHELHKPVSEYARAHMDRPSRALDFEFKNKPRVKKVMAEEEEASAAEVLKRKA